MSRDSGAGGAGTASRTPRIDLRWATLRRQLAECVVLPVIAVTLPWPLAWRAMRALAARGRFFESETARAQAMCDAQGLVQDATSWAQRQRVTRIVDHIDPALSLVRGDRFIDRYVVVDGDSVPRGPCLFVGFHYGAGFWSLRHLRRLGHRVSFLAAAVTAAHCPGQPLQLAFMQLRKVCVERAGGAPVIFVGGSREKMRAALRAGTSVLGLVDVPEASTSAVAVTLLGRDVWLADGLLRLARAENVPLVAYVASLDARTGTRHIRFTRLPDDPAGALHAVAAMLDAAIRRDPAAWHFWPEWPRFVRPPSAAASNQGGVAALR
jgi:hypothetical protein